MAISDINYAIHGAITLKHSSIKDKGTRNTILKGCLHAWLPLNHIVCHLYFIGNNMFKSFNKKSFPYLFLKERDRPEGGVLKSLT